MRSAPARPRVIFVDTRCPALRDRGGEHPGRRPGQAARHCDRGRSSERDHHDGRDSGGCARPHAVGGRGPDAVRQSARLCRPVPPPLAVPRKPRARKRVGSHSLSGTTRSVRRRRRSRGDMPSRDRAGSVRFRGPRILQWSRITALSSSLAPRDSTARYRASRQLVRGLALEPPAPLRSSASPRFPPATACSTPAAALRASSHLDRAVPCSKVVPYASASSFSAVFSQQRDYTSSCALVDDAAHLFVDELLRVPADTSDAPGRNGPRPSRGSTATGPTAVAHAPAADHLARDLASAAGCRTRRRSLGLAVDDSSAARPPSATLIFAAAPERAVVEAVASGAENVTPSARPRGMIEILRTGSAPSVSIPTIAWPRLVVRGAAAVLAGVIITCRSAPRTIRSSASVKSASSTTSWLAPRGEQRRLVDEVREIGADHARRRRGDPARGRRRPRAARRACAPSRIASRPARSGGCTATRRSNRPGRSSAWSSTSGRLVAPITITLRRRVEAVHLGEDLVQRLLALVVAAAEAGDAGRARPADRVELVDEDDRRRGLLRLREQVAHALTRRRRRSPRRTPTRPCEKNGTSASPRDRPREQRLARARRAREQHPVRDPRRRACRYLSGWRRKSTTSDSSAFASSIPAHVREASRGRRTAGSGEPASGRTSRGCSARCPRRRISQNSSDDEEDRRAEPEYQVPPPRRARVQRLRDSRSRLLPLQRLRLKAGRSVCVSSPPGSP